MRTYRVQVAGRFERPQGELRERLLAEQAEHDYTVSAFTPEGTFTYADALTRFTLRYLLEIDAPTAVEADEQALVEGEVRAEEYLAARGIGHGELTTTSTCLEDVKPRR